MREIAPPLSEDVERKGGEMMKKGKKNSNIKIQKTFHALDSSSFFIIHFFIYFEVILKLSRNKCADLRYERQMLCGQKDCLRETLNRFFFFLLKQ